MIVVSLSALFVSATALFVAYVQMRIAAAKIKLDLYNRRFEVYVSALDLYIAFYPKSRNVSYEEIEEKTKKLTKNFRESRFLFSPGDGVYDALKQIQQNASTAYAGEKGQVSHESKSVALVEFEKNLLLLEERIQKYIQFENISGWTWVR